MYSSQAIFNDSFSNLTQRWNHLSATEEMDVPEFHKLHQETLKVVLDFRWALIPKCVDESLIANFSQSLCSIRFDASHAELKESVENLACVAKWDEATFHALLSGKVLSSRGVKFLKASEKKLMSEEDNIIQGRIESLMELFRNNNTPEVSQMILNCLETYKKFLICEIKFQNKISGVTIDMIIKALLVVLCHRKDFDHFGSMIEYLPHHRKLKFIINQINKDPISQVSKKLYGCELLICAAIAQDLLKSAFKKPQSEQSLMDYNLYINLIIDLALQKSFLDSKLETIFLSATDMNVSSDYYYLVANLLRLKMPNLHQNLVVKLISIGLSNDLTRLEQIKYTKASNHANAPPKSTEEDFIAIYHKMFKALTTLGFVIEDYSLRRLCIEAACFCEPATGSCSQILKFLPKWNTEKAAVDPSLELTLLYLREQLEIFQSAIKMEVNLSETWEKSSCLSYDKLDFHHRRTQLSDNLQPLEYPGIERNLKRIRKESTSEVETVEQQPLDALKILDESKVFAETVSTRLKKIKNPFKCEEDKEAPISSLVRKVITQVLRNNQDFEIEREEIFMKLTPEATLENLLSYEEHLNLIFQEQHEKNEPHLLFDFAVREENSLNGDIQSMYQKGTIYAFDLCRKGLNLFDLENVMLYAIMVKKNLFMHQEFIVLNKNQAYEDTLDQIQGAFNYLMFRPQPEVNKLTKIVNMYSNIFEFYLDNYAFDAIPGKYKFIKKNKQDPSLNEEIETNRNDVSMDNSDVNLPEKVLPAKKPSNKPPRIAKPATPKSMTPAKELPVMQILPKPKKENVQLKPDETFHASDDLIGILLLLQNELSLLIGQKVSIDMTQMTDQSSQHKVEFTHPNQKTEFLIKVQKRRNNKFGLLTTKDVHLPARVHGSIQILLCYQDDIVYDDNFDNPHIVTTYHPKLSGVISVEHLSHNIKNIDLDFKVGETKHKLKFSMRSQGTSKKIPKCKALNDSGSDKERSMPSTKRTSELIMHPFELEAATVKPENFEEPLPVADAHDSSHPIANNDFLDQNQTSVDQPLHTAIVSYTNDEPQKLQAPVQNVSPMVPEDPSEYCKPIDIVSQSSLNRELPFVLPNISFYNENNMEIVTPPSQNTQTMSPAHHSSINQVPESSYPMSQVIETPPVVSYTSVIVSPAKSVSSSPIVQLKPNHSLPPVKSVSPKTKVQIIKIESVSPQRLSNGNAPDFKSYVQDQIKKRLTAVQPFITLSVKEKPHQQELESLNSSMQNVEIEVDFETQLPSVHLYKPKLEPVFGQTPPTSPPPLHYPKVDLDSIKTEVDLVSEPVGSDYRSELAPKSHIINTPPEEVIDLTEDTENQPSKRLKPMTSRPCPASKKILDPFEYTFCGSSSYQPEIYESEMPSSGVVINYNHINEKTARAQKKKQMKNMQLNGMKRHRSSMEEANNGFSSKDVRLSCVHLVDVIRNIDKENLKRHMSVEQHLFTMMFPPNVVPHRPDRKDFQIRSVELEQPYDDPLSFVDDICKSTFHVTNHQVYQNSVSYCEDYQSGDGTANILTIANNQCNEDTSFKANRFEKHLNNANVNMRKLKMSNVDNNANNRFAERFANVELSKTFYSDKNRFNFTKNLKNYKKFSRLTSPKVSNDSFSKEIFDEKKGEKKFNDEKSYLYQMSHDILETIPGMNSLEFFQLSPKHRRDFNVNVIHLYKDMKNGGSSTSDNDGEKHTESKNLQTENANGESSTHIHKIGQTSINRECDSKTIQTSFGSIIKNTYPPATLSARAGNGSEIMKNIEKEQQKFVKLKNDEVQIKKIITHEALNKPNSNIKIVACSSNAQQLDVQKSNRNQTLINMLTQQVMLPTNSNRHFIITSTKSDLSKNDGNITTVTSASTTHQSLVKKVVATPGQSQLVQILNSPPSNFTMKTLNTLNTSVSTTPTKPPNQAVTVAPTSMNNTTFKAELPTAAKQQGIVQFICKTDGKIIHLTPICSNSAGGTSKKITYKVDTSGAKGPTILHHANQQIIINNQMKKSDNQNILTIIQKQDDGDKKNKSPMLSVAQSPSTPTSPISTRSIYEETYAKFIQTSSSSKVSDMGLLTISSSTINSPIASSSSPGSIIQKIGKTVIQSSNQVLPKFNQAFGKTIFTTTSQSNEQFRTKVVGSKETLTTRQSFASYTETKPVTKLTRTISEIKSTDAGTLLSLIESEPQEKQQHQLPTLQSALQNNLLYARSIGNGKLITSNSNNVLLTALRGNNQSGNVRIITSIADNSNRSPGTIMAPMRISVPINIPKLINTTVRPQTSTNFRQQIVIATTPTRVQQSTTSNQQSGSKLESLLMTTQPTIVKQEVEVEQHQQSSMEPKQKKNVDHSTLEQLREFDMVLEQVLERSSSEMTSTSMSSPPTPESSAQSSPKKLIIGDGKIKTTVTITSISPSGSSSPKGATATSGTAVAKTVPKLQEDEHTAQRILDILANYKEQVRNSPDLNNKPAPRRRANPPTNPPAAKRKKVASSGGSGSIKNSKQYGSNSDMMTDTMGSEEDSSCGMGSGVASTGSMNNSPQPQDLDDQTDVSMDNNFYMEDSKRETALSPQSSSSSVATSPSHNKFPVSRRIILTETKTSSGNEMCFSPNKNIVITNAPSSSAPTGTLGTTIERFAAQGSTAAVLMPGNYLLPMNVLKGGQQLAILSSNNGQKIIAVPTNQLTSLGNNSGTSIILQRYLNQAHEAANKAVLSSSDGTQHAFKSVRLQQSPSVTYINNKNNSVTPSANTLYIRPIQNMSQGVTETKTIITNHPTLVKQEDDAMKDSQNSKFVSDKTLITEIIQQQQQLSHTHQHPQQNFMIKLNEHQPSDPRSSSSIMFVPNSSSSGLEGSRIEAPKIKIEEIDYDDYMKEDAIDLLNETDSMAKSPMLNTKIEVDENTNSNHESSNIYDDSCIKVESDQEQKFQQFPIILNSSHGKGLGVNQVSCSKSIKGFLIDPSNKIVMYNDRRPATIEKEYFNQKSFSEECADLGVDEPIASDLFPEADLLFDSGSPKFDQIGSHDGGMHIKKELENGQVLLEMNYNHNMETESWLNFDTEEELVDNSPMGDDVDGDGGGGHSGNLKDYF